MEDYNDNTIRTNSSAIAKSNTKKTILSGTTEIARDTFVAKRPTKQHAFLEVMDEADKFIELEEDDILIGRVDECDLQLMVENVSRKHAHIFYLNEEYRIEDLGSTNGIYINGVKVEKGILRDQDILEIGGVKILFREGKIRI